MNRTLLVALVVGAIVSGVPVYAHHSFPATYLVDDTMTIEGNLVAFLFKNPHSFVQVIADDADGQAQRWAVEWGGGAFLRRQEITRETLRPGDHLIITGNPGRNPADHRLRLRKIERPADGWEWGGDFD